MGSFTDGLTSVYNSIMNIRNAMNSNEFTSNAPINNNELLAIYKTGIGKKIATVKASYATKSSSMVFADEATKRYYLAVLEEKVKLAFLWSIVFGRGIIVINDGGDLSEPLSYVDKSKVTFSVFSGDMVSVNSCITDLNSPMYYKPSEYQVRGVTFHPSRVIDFTYVKLPEIDLPKYRYGGISEYELIYSNLVNDAIIERAGAVTLEKSSSLFYKIRGFKDALRSKKDEAIVQFYSHAENRRSVLGAGLIDADDEVVTVNQTLGNFAEIDNSSLRRIAMATGIPLPMLIGENVQGLNSSGTQEKTAFNDMIENLQQDFLLTPLNILLNKLGLATMSFKDNQNVTPLEKIEYESKVIDNAIKLNDFGIDSVEYMKANGLEYLVQKEL